jgi:hypothetical protein
MPYNENGTKRERLLSLSILETFTGCLPGSHSSRYRFRIPQWRPSNVRLRISDLRCRIRPISNVSLDWSAKYLVASSLVGWPGEPGSLPSLPRFFYAADPPGIDMTPNARIEFSPDRGGSSSQCDTGANAGLSPWRSAR